jgi:hypothetical protein
MERWESTMINKVEKHSEICERLKSIYTAKNKDYGDSFGEGFKEYGEIMPAIRIDDKLRRFKQLIKNEPQVKDEAMIDTLLDMANYCIMTVIELENQQENINLD